MSQTEGRGVKTSNVDLETQIKNAPANFFYREIWPTGITYMISRIFWGVEATEKNS